MEAVALLPVAVESHRGRGLRPQAVAGHPRLQGAVHRLERAQLELPSVPHRSRVGGVHRDLGQRPETHALQIVARLRQGGRVVASIGRAPKRVLVEREVRERLRAAQHQLFSHVGLALRLRPQRVRRLVQRPQPLKLE